MRFLNGVDANYVLLLESLGIMWRDEGGGAVDDVYRYLAGKGVNCARIRLWVGDEGPSRFRYAKRVMERASGAGMELYLVLFLSEGWADLYKQPAPRAWRALSVEERAEAVESYVVDVLERLEGYQFRLYEVGNEVDYGVCGVFASDKKRRRDVNWLKRRVWRREAVILRAAMSAIRQVDPETPVMIHLGKWWDERLARAFLASMEEYGVEFEVLGLTFYPTGLGVGLEALERLKSLAEEFGKDCVIAEYAYPSKPMRGMFWFMSKQVPGYPLTPEGQARWIRDFLHTCRRVGISGAFYWSPELYLSRRAARRLPAPPEMPIDFGWSPMALFSERGRAKPGIKSLSV
ncbi:MAG: hypothetical protein DRK00_04105 [Thermoprotei archaeon]|nr:MAG: hypothetical protein DRK00_04105 [Thermoprotei archaeon]